MNVLSVLDNAILQIHPANLIDVDADTPTSGASRLYCATLASDSFIAHENGLKPPSDVPLAAVFNSSSGTPRDGHVTTIDAVTINAVDLTNARSSIQLPPAVLLRGALLNVVGAIHPLEGAFGVPYVPIVNTFGSTSSSNPALNSTIVPPCGSLTLHWPSLYLADLPVWQYGLAIAANKGSSRLAVAPITGGGGVNATRGAYYVIGHIFVTGASSFVITNPNTISESTFLVLFASLDVRTTSASTMASPLGLDLESARLTLLTTGAVAFRCFVVGGGTECQQPWGGRLTLVAGTLFIGQGMRFISMRDARSNSGPGYPDSSILGTAALGSGGAHGGCGVSSPCAPPRCTRNAAACWRCHWPLLRRSTCSLCAGTARAEHAHMSARGSSGVEEWTSITDHVRQRVSPAGARAHYSR